MSGTATFTYKIVSTTGYEAEGEVSGITPRQYAEVLAILNGRPLPSLGEETQPEPPAPMAQNDVAVWQFRWTNPGNYEDQPADLLAWKEVVPRPGQTMEQRLDELRGYRSANGQPIYEVRALGVIGIGKESGE